jgi:segregation and condensation protein B
MHAARREAVLVTDGPTARPARVARLEAVLFLAREPLASRKLAQLSRLADGTEARTLVRELNRLYDAEGSALDVVEVAGGFQLMSRPPFAPWLRRLHSSAAEVRLSGPALETLSVVAYRQPVLRARIEAIRGVQCSEILRQLMERDLVRIVGRSEELGRPLLYGTTKRFLQVFGLRNLDELPQPEGHYAAEPDTDSETPEPETPEPETPEPETPEPETPESRTSDLDG